jgi:hypothetical protein
LWLHRQDYLDSEVLTALDRYHLQLQIDLGKQDAPYKETIVEEAIAQWLERSEKSPDRATSVFSQATTAMRFGSVFALGRSR